ncbi:MAG: mechanosensitive ion channel family protein [Haloarculaceae archaeon]
MNVAAQYWSAYAAFVAGRPAWQVFLAVLVGSLAVAWVVRVGGDAVIRRLTVRIEGDVDDVVLTTVHPPIYLTVVAGGAYLAVHALGLTSELDGLVRAGTLTALTVVWTWTLTKLGRAVSRAVTDGEAVDREVVPIFQNVWTAVVVAVGAFAVLSVWRVDVTPLLASAGILGIVLGFAAKDTIANFFGSIALYADGTYKVGDYVVLDSGERGRVQDISIRSTVLRTRDDVLVTVPNSVLSSARLVNESTPRRERRIRVPVGVAYDSDLEHVEEVLLGVADAEDLVIDHPKPRVRFRGFGDSAVEVELLCWIRDPVLRGRATHHLVKGVHVAFREAGVEIPFPQRELSFRDSAEAAPAPVGDADGRAEEVPGDD